jgi:hypothetical protein
MDALQVKALIPVWVQGSLADGGRLGLFTVYGRNSEGIRKTYSSVNQASIDIVCWAES